jgi:hypothetical protein
LSSLSNTPWNSWLCSLPKTLKNSKRELLTGKRTLRLLTLSSEFGLRHKETG